MSLTASTHRPHVGSTALQREFLPHSESEEHISNGRALHCCKLSLLWPWCLSSQTTAKFKLYCIQAHPVVLFVEVSHRL